MKVLLITHNIESTSGWGRNSYEVAASLKRHGVDPVLLLEKPPIDRGWESIRLYPLSLFNFLRNFFIVRHAAQSCEIVHALDGWPYGVYGFFAVLGTKKKLFINGIGTYSVAPLYARIKGMLLRISYERATRIFCISSFTKKQIAKKLSLRNLEVVHLGSTPLPQPTTEEIALISKKYKLDSTNPILLTVGQIKNRKGQYETLQAVKLLKDTFQSIRYLMVGSDADMSYINRIQMFIRENNMEDNVQIISNIKTDTELSCIYELSTIVLLNSNTERYHFEGFGLVLLEANQFGKPVVGSRNSGIEDAIQDGYNGLLSEQRNPSDIAKKVIQIMNSYTLFSSQAKIFEKKFSWDQTVEKYIMGYQMK